MSTPTRFRAAGDRAAARLRKRAEWAFTAAQRRAAHDLAYEQWITGALAPYRITRALDAAELYGRGRRHCMRGAGAGSRRMGGRHSLPLVRAAPRPGRADPPIPGLVHRTRRRRGPRPPRHHDVVPHQQSRARPMATPDHRIHRRSRRRMSRHQRIPRHPPVLKCPCFQRERSQRLEIDWQVALFRDVIITSLTRELQEA
jgi:hypothetical protein